MKTIEGASEPDRTLAYAGWVENEALLKELRWIVARVVSRLYTNATSNDREDAIQRVFVVLIEKYRRRKINGGEDGLKALVRKIASFTTRAFRRRDFADKQHTSEPPLDFNPPDTNIPSPEKALIDKRLIAALIEPLKEQERNVVELRAVQGLSYDEIGRILKIEPSNAGVLYYRAIRKMRRHMSIRKAV